MLVSLHIAGRQFTLDVATGRSIAIPVRFDEAQANLFGVAAATAETVEQGDFRGDTRRGGTCNVMKLSLIPHCHGTHTESVSHIVDDDVPVIDCVEHGMFPAVVATVQPTRLGDAAADSYPQGDPNDRIITLRDMEQCLSAVTSFPAAAVVIRTLPNDPSKQVARYDREPVPAYFSVEAMERLAASDVRHLLVDLPSIDRVFDGGQLRNHHRFWNVAPASRRASTGTRVDRTITEFCFVPSDLTDGWYLLNLQLPEMGIDASPSRPLLWPLQEVEKI